jgi:hypothetical protein
MWHVKWGTSRICKTSHVTSPKQNMFFRGFWWLQESMCVCVSLYVCEPKTRLQESMCVCVSLYVCEKTRKSDSDFSALLHFFAVLTMKVIDLWTENLISSLHKNFPHFDTRTKSLRRSCDPDWRTPNFFYLNRVVGGPKRREKW